MRTQTISEKNLAFYQTSGTSVGNQVVNVNTDNTNSGDTFIDYVVQCVATTNITLSGTFAIDGITPAIGQKVLVTAQTTASNNGIYIVQSGAWIRAFTLLPMMFIKVLQGTLGANSVWCLIVPITSIQTGDSISFRRIDNNFIPSTVQVQSASAFRSTIGLGTMATQNANNVAITGGFLNITGSNSQINVGQLSGYTLRTSSTGTGQLMNATGSSYLRHVSGERWELLSNTSSNPFWLELNSATNTNALLNYVRNRTSGNTSHIDRKRVNTTSTLHIFDSMYDSFVIQPTSGVIAENQVSHIVTNASTTVPDTAMQISLTIAGALKRIMRIVDRGIQLWNGSTNAVRLLVSNALTVNYDIILPTTAPQSGQITTHDGTGQQYFENHVYTCSQQVNSNITMQNNYHYSVFDDASVRRVLTLPTNANSRVGMYIRVSRSPYNLDSFRIAQNAVQRIYVDETSTTEGITGYIDSDSIDTSLLLYCFRTDQSTYAMWQVVSKVGQIIIN